MTNVFLTRSSAGVDWYMEDDHDAEVTHFHAVQDLEPILDANTTAQNHNDGYTPDKSWRRAATIPVTVQMLWLTKYGVDIYSADPEQQKKVAQLLDSSDWRYLRTAHFHIGDHWRHSI